MKKLEDILDWLRNFLLPASNDTVKVVALCIIAATTFWFFNALNGTYNTRIEYPINFTYPDSTHIIVEPLPKYIDIDVTGGGWSLLRRTFWFTSDDLEIPLENPHNVRFILSSTLQGAIIEGLADLKLNRILTDSLHIQIDKKVSKTIKVVVDSADIKLAENYRIISPIDLTIDTVVVSGPERFIQKIPTIYTLEITQEGISTNYREKIKLPDFDSKLVGKVPDELRVGFDVAMYVETDISLNYEKVGFYDGPKSWKPIEPIAQLTIIHKEKALQETLVDSIQLQIDFKKINWRDSTIMPQIMYVPEELKQWEISPKKIKITKD